MLTIYVVNISVFEDLDASGEYNKVKNNNIICCSTSVVTKVLKNIHLTILRCPLQVLFSVLKFDLAFLSTCLGIPV